MPNEPSTEGQLRLLRKLAHVSDLIALLIVLLPAVFVSQQGMVFGVYALAVLFWVLVQLRSIRIASISFTQKAVIMVLLGFGFGLFQLTLIPSLALVFLLLFSILNISAMYRMLLLLSFFVAAIIGYFFAKAVFSIAQTNHPLVNLAGFAALFFSLVVKYIYLQSKYDDVAVMLTDSKERFTHFMQMANKLARYTPEQVWQSIVQDNKEVKIENKNKKLSIFFSDIQGFTDLSDTLSPDDLAQFLNTYFESMSAVAKRHGGTIDKFIGDALMVFFGDPDSKGPREDALACVEMALDMRREMTKLRSHWRALGFEGLHVRMGVNTGYCHVGNFGSQARLSYTAIGREVNLAARIQSAAKLDQILISQSTFDLIYHNYICRKSQPVRLKGIFEPVVLYEVVSVRQGSDKRMQRWVEHDLPGFNLHLNMRNMKSVDKARIRQALRDAVHTLDESIKHEE